MSRKLSLITVLIVSLAVHWTLGATIRLPVTFREMKAKLDRKQQNNIVRGQGELMKKYMNSTADPCDDFYQFSCGNWAKYNPIPVGELENSNIELVNRRIKLILKGLLEGKNSRNEAELKAQNLYKSCMNMKNLRKQGLKPLLELIKKMGGWPVLDVRWNATNFDWLKIAGELRLLGINALINADVHPDMLNENRFALYLGEINFEIIKKHEYVSETESVFMFAFKKVMIDTMVRFGANRKSAIQAATELLEFESNLAKLSKDENEENEYEVEDDDSTELIGPLSIKELTELIPGIEWSKYFETILGHPVNSSFQIIVHDESYLKNLSQLIAKTEPRIVANYLLIKLMFIFDETPVKKLRWNFCVEQVSTHMESVVSLMYVRRYYDEENQKTVKEITEEIRTSFKDIIEEIPWLDNSTKQLAQRKLQAVRLKIGFPDNILSSNFLINEYKDIRVNHQNYFINRLNFLRHKTIKDFARIGTDMDRDEWAVGAAIVNAFYDLLKNMIIIPAGILQPPIFHKTFPKSLIFSSLGYLIGHELTHAFDYEGREFDINGNMHNWWSETSTEAFIDRAQCLISQYMNYSVNGTGIPIGENTLSENIADNGGLRQSFFAYQNWLKHQRDPEILSHETLPNLNMTNIQLFFLNFAQMWCSEQKPAGTLLALRNAEHTLEKFRVIGALSNFEEFSKAFQCKNNSSMNPTNKCRVW